MTTSDQIIARLRRKAEIVRLDTKARQDAVHHDMNEILSLLDMLERTLAQEKSASATSATRPARSATARGSWNTKCLSLTMSTAAT